jgi:pseudoazurin
MRQILATMFVAAALAAAGTAQAAEHEVRMLNKGERGMMVFEPAFVQAQPGDTIHFIAVDKGHNAETIKGMLPEGAEGFKGKIGQDVTYKVEAEGIYGIKCAPHYAMGMVAVISVGEPVNATAAQAVKHPAKAAAVFDELLGKAIAAAK